MDSGHVGPVMSDRYGAEDLPVKADGLDYRVDWRPFGKPESFHRLAGQTRQERLPAAIKTQFENWAVVWTEFHDEAAQHVERAKPLGGSCADHHVAGADMHPHSRTEPAVVEQGHAELTPTEAQDSET